MAFFPFRVGFILLFVAGLAAAIQVTPNSPCTSVCNNGGSTPGQKLSQTNEEDIVCNDEAYSSGKGQQFQQCLDCLQTSSFGTDAENDQMWFIYNLRYAADWCFFGTNNPENLSGPCMVDTACDPLSKSLSAGNESTKAGDIFDYCSADNAQFSSIEPVCYTCLQHMEDNFYISNFLIALQAGCSQRPTQSSLIGLEGSVFSLFPVNVTTPFSNGQTETITTNSSHGLSTGAKAGIAISSIVVAIIIASVILIRLFKCRRARNINSLDTHYDPRHGSRGIGPPTEGAYSSNKLEPVSEIPWGTQNIAMSGVHRGTSPPASAYTKFSSISSARSSLAGSPEPLTLAAAPLGMRTITPIPAPAPAPPLQPAGPPNPLRMNSVLTDAPRPIKPTQPTQPSHNQSISTTYASCHIPGRASSIFSTSTTFSPPSATSPPTFPTTLHNHNSRPSIPLPTYNPRDYAPAPAIVPALRPAPPPTQPLPQPPPQRLQKQTVPIIALPIPAPKRNTIDMRSYIGLGISTTATTTTPVPSSVPISAVQADPPVPLPRPASLRDLAGRLLPSPKGGDGEHGERVDSGEGVRDRGRRRSGSRPRRERSESRTRLRDGVRDGGRRQFEFRGQDTVSPQSAAESVEMWPGRM